MKMDTTKIHCLLLLRDRYPQPQLADDIVKSRWPQSKQPAKKVKTIERHFRDLLKDGLVQRAGQHTYTITKLGKLIIPRVVEEVDGKLWLLPLNATKLGVVS